MNVRLMQATTEHRGLRCMTRALKNVQYLRVVAPHLVDSTGASEGLGTGLPLDVLARLHRLRHDAPEVVRHQALAEFLKDNRLPVPARNAGEPLFNGIIHFVQVSFATPAGTFVLPDADMNTIVRYALHAAVPISAGADQYGPNRITVSPTFIGYSVTLPGTSFNDPNVQGWVNDVLTRNQLTPQSCVVMVCPQGVTAPGVGGNTGYHGLANSPYIILGVFATGLTLPDVADVYAMVVSHEIAEMVVDPRVNGANPEVCDPCDINCNNLTRAYFDGSDDFLGSNQASPPGGFNFTYYICAIAKPEGVSNCPAASADCGYSPDFGSGVACFGVNGTDSRVYRVTSDGHVHEMAWVGRWVHNDLTGLVPGATNHECPRA